MSEAFAAFEATFCDVKLIKGRKMVQLVFEVPVETSKQALDALGGMPNPANDVWCAIARLDRDKIAKPEKPAKAFRDMSVGQQAGIFCSDPGFWAFLKEKHGIRVRDQKEAADFLREHFNVKSRADIDPNAWARFSYVYRNWPAEIG